MSGAEVTPRGGRYPEKELSSLLTDLRAAVFHAGRVAQMRRTPAAETRWEVLYARMAEPSPGLFGAVVARAEAQVLRLACLYALLDKTDSINVPHLDAAYALWRYCEASARYIFGTLLGDPLADDIYQMLQQMTPDGYPTDISNAMGRPQKRAALRLALGRLLREGMARYTVDKTSSRRSKHGLHVVREIAN